MCDLLPEPLPLIEPAFVVHAVYFCSVASHPPHISVTDRSSIIHGSLTLKNTCQICQLRALPAMVTIVWQRSAAKEF